MSKVEEFLRIITNVGFPIAVSVYLLIRIENKLSDLSRAICDLREAIITLPLRRDTSPRNSSSRF
ncbi:MAG TPA: YvrJ family protein [Syntrophomonadaceae bacterium]|nr:YvrJ family protein [Syntrophomonadaceae bacterium]